MNKIRVSVSIVYTAILFLSGCAQKSYEPLERICVPGANKAAVMNEAEDVLAKMNFAIDKADTEEGIIRTRPLRGAQSFEFWRSDNIGSFNTAEANLHTVRRTAELNVSENQGRVCVSCDVRVQRMSLPERELSSETETAGMFTKSGSSLQKLELHPEQKAEMAWIDLGKDNRLETEILQRLRDKLAGR